MLVNGSRILGVAHENSFAIPAFNAGMGQLFTATMERCEELAAPFIMAIHPSELAFLRDSFIGQVLWAINRTDLPVALHLDHGATYQQVIHSIHLGFTSVMIDASMKPFEENVAITRKVVEAAHATGVSVEAELGTIADTGKSIEGHLTDDVIYTDPAVAKQFVKQTHVDSLAVAIGTAHGLYPEDVQPKLRPEIVADIAAVVDIPLVLHGASDNPDSEIATAIRNGINKVNISSDIKRAFSRSLRQILESNDVDEIREPRSMFPDPIDAVKSVVEKKVRLCNSYGTASLYFTEDRLHFNDDEDPYGIYQKEAAVK